MQLTNAAKTILAKTAVAAGATDIVDATAIDTQGYEGVRFIVAFGTIVAGAVTSVAAAGKTADNNPVPGTDDLAGTKITVADTDDDKLVVLDIHKPVQRYIRPFVKRATQNATVNAIVAELYDSARKEPVAKDSTVTLQELHVSPAVGTA